ncbi:hypothetical protein A2392_00190 [Candidatus Kaiserbacteria bacterium RIFOXYB1_FULL_46_14]|uniref:Uncharacterized protein n=1 Tax=Candidatus Kaiserbacteria bacterium RIFOXYB1_FULL_46_14 TaxID=1798531 RepID=A0A1F6FJ13_9BACT|nr:MAG: hypothetical protein A2392_00190 [Candidatus Kaiserbacteria bacterium RIFOXYB1_FULL_46_14]
MQEQIENLAAAGNCNGQMIAALENLGYKVITDPFLGKGVSAVSSDGEQVTCYHPRLDENKTADP